VTQDEPVTDKREATSPDAATGANSNQVQLRAEANPQGNGRVYRIAYTVSDGNGGTCTGVETVSVARKKGQTAIDDGNRAAWNSFTGAQVTP